MDLKGNCKPEITIISNDPIKFTDGAIKSRMVLFNQDKGRYYYGFNKRT